MKKITFTVFLTLSFFLFSCTELQQIADQLPGGTGQGIGTVSSQQISSGLKQALELGVNEGVEKLAAKNGYFKNELTKILLPQELQQVDETLRKIGLGNLADEGLRLLNRAAEDAVTEAKPIFVDAITGITFTDAKNILLGGDNSATNFLQTRTQNQLYNAFKPKIQNSLGKVGADRIWSDIIQKYNTIARNKINPDLNAYVTEQAINGVFKMVAQKEEGIRNKVGLRTTPLLQQVFALQDQK